MMRLLTIGLSLCLAAACGTVACTSSKSAQAAMSTSTERVLVFSKTAEFRHTSIEAGAAALQEIGKSIGYEVDWTEDAARFSESGLAGYDAVVFLSTTGDVLDGAQQEAFERFIKGGKGYVGIHAAADTEYDWPFYRELVGRQFVQHPEHQRGKILPVDRDFPGMAGFGDSLTIFEEWYEYTQPYATDLNYLYRIDTTSYSRAGYKGPCKMGEFHPLGWYHEHAGGRAFYTGIGHMDETFKASFFRDHLAAGMHWAVTGKKTKP